MKAAHLPNVMLVGHPLFLLSYLSDKTVLDFAEGACAVDKSSAAKGKKVRHSCTVWDACSFHWTTCTWGPTV